MPIPRWSRRFSMRWLPPARTLPASRPADLAPVDEFHTGGRQATVDLAEQLNFSGGMHLLDIGCGIGGASGYFSESRACRVTGIDLTDVYVRTAAALSKRVGLAERLAALTAKNGVPPLGIHILMKTDVPEKLVNYVGNIEAGLIAPVEVIARAR
jgi:SAM-dependent methyltransferase